MFVWCLVLIVPVVWTLSFWYRRRHMYKLASKIRSTKDDLPLLGAAYACSGNSENTMNRIKQYNYESMQNNGLVKIWVGPLLYFNSTDAVDVEFVLKTCLEKDDFHRFFRNLFGNGGVFAPVSIWRRRRKVLVPAFSPKIVENFVNVFAEQSLRLVKTLKEYSDKGKFCMWPLLASYTLDSVCDTATGVKLNALENPDSPFLNAMSSALNLVCERAITIYLQPDWLYRFFPQYKQHQSCIHVLHEFTDEVIKKKRKELKLQESTTDVDHEYDIKLYKTKTFLDVLIHLSGGEKGFTDVELREEVLTITIAGTDTSAVAVGYILQMLSKYPDVQEKVYQELCDIFSDDRRLVKEDLMKMKYLERVIKETLRLFPPVPLISRKVLEDIKLPSGAVLPAGSGVLCSIWGLHRNPKYWGSNAEKFDPDRFLPDRFKLAHACSYMPFSHGPRNCVGYQYALMSIKTVVSTLLRNYKVVENKDIDISNHRVKLEIMMKAVDGYEVALERRDKAFT